MYKKIYLRKYIITSLIFIVILTFDLTIFLTTKDRISNLDIYLELPFYLKFICGLIIPLFKDFNYLFNLTNFYIYLIIISYLIYLLKNKNYTSLNYLPIKKIKRQFNNLLFNYLLILPLTLIHFILVSILEVTIYNNYSLNCLISFLCLNLLILTILFIKYYLNNNKLYYILISIYALIVLLIYEFTNVNILYYFSPLSILITTNSNYLSLIFYLLLITIMIICRYIKSRGNYDERIK